MELKNVAHSAKKGIVNFMLEGDNKERAIEKIEKQHESAIEKATKKADEKAAKKKAKVEAKAERKANHIPLREKVKAFCLAENEEEYEVDENHSIFWDKDGLSYQAVLITAKEVLNEKYEAFAKETLKGQALLKRNVKTSPLFVDDEGNLVKVTSVKEVAREFEDVDTAYVLLETKYEDFVLEFKAVRSF